MLFPSEVCGNTLPNADIILPATTQAVSIIQTNSQADTATFKMAYRWNVYNSLDISYRDNKKVLEDLTEYLNTFPQIDSVKIVAYASPEGGSPHNMELSRKRALYFRDFIIGLTPEGVNLTEDMFRIVSPGENWDGLAEAVEKGYWQDNREKVLKILRDRKVGSETLKWRLQQLDDGETYRLLIRKFMPELRYASSVIFYEKGRGYPALTAVEGTMGGVKLEPPIHELRLRQPEAQPETQPEIQSEPKSEPRPSIFDKIYGINLSTNLLTDILILPNLRADVSLSDNISFSMGFASSWWKNEPTWFWEYYGGDIGINWWFGKAAKAKPLSGHHIGAYAQVMTYDFLVWNKGILGCDPGGNIFDSAQFSAGLEYGYTLPLSERISFDFGIGAGYMGGRYYEYHLEDGHYVWTATKDRQWFGPTRVRAALVVQLGRNNVNRDKRGKGGAR